jgi:hypothetical protein
MKRVLIKSSWLVTLDRGIEPAVIERLRDLGSDARPTTPEGFKERVADDVAKWTKVVADAKISKV